jgi:U6 snRNA-associated Sm-like protein LSm7
MSERGSFRGGRGGRGGRQPQQKSGGGGGAQEKPKKENILDLNKYMDKEVMVKFNGGREGEFESPHLFNAYLQRLDADPP